jgi:hypothetical protein
VRIGNSFILGLLASSAAGEQGRSQPKILSPAPKTTFKLKDFCYATTELDSYPTCAATSALPTGTKRVLPAKRTCLPLSALPRPHKKSYIDIEAATPASRATDKFRRTYQHEVLQSPGAVTASRKSLGLKRTDQAIVDVGGEGAKIDLLSGFRSGNAYAINLNANQHVTSTPILLQKRPNKEPQLATGTGIAIPNLIRPAEDWDEHSASQLRYPLADGFSNLTLAENIPLRPAAMEEIARITDRAGWIALSVSENFQDETNKLAKLHNGGTIWKIPDPSGAFTRQVMPPRNLHQHYERTARRRLSRATSHDLHEAIKPPPEPEAPGLGR